MPAQKSKKVKLYIIVGLLCVAVIVAYFRFIKKKPDSDAEIAKSPPQEVTFNVSQIEKPRLKKRLQEPRQPVNEFLRMNIRDIFSPVRLPIESQLLIQSEQMPVPTGVLTLKGTIIGGENPMAIINDKFVQMGEKIGGYQIVRIDPNEVLLRSDSHEKVLQVLKPSDKK